MKYTKHQYQEFKVLKNVFYPKSPREIGNNIFNFVANFMVVLLCQISRRRPCSYPSK